MNNEQNNAEVCRQAQVGLQGLQIIRRRSEKMTEKKKREPGSEQVKRMKEWLKGEIRTYRIAVAEADFTGDHKTLEFREAHLEAILKAEEALIRIDAQVREERLNAKQQSRRRQEKKQEKEQNDE